MAPRAKLIKKCWSQFTNFLCKLVRFIIGHHFPQCIVNWRAYNNNALIYSKLYFWDWLMGAMLLRNLGVNLPILLCKLDRFIITHHFPQCMVIY
jgi:hypothetical protein